MPRPAFTFSSRTWSGRPVRHRPARPWPWLAVWLGLGLAAGVLAAPLELAWFELGDGGGERTVAVPERILENLGARGWEVQAVKPGQLGWTDAIAPGGERLIGGTVRFGTRLETLFLLVGADGRTRLAIRRPATSTFAIRPDGGQPGPNQGLDNAYTEACADLAHAMPPAPLPEAALSLLVEKLAGDGDAPGAGRFEAVDRYGMEALALTAITCLGHPASRAAGGPAGVRLAATREAVQVAIDATAGDRHYAKRHLPQESLYPSLAAALRKLLLPGGDAIADFRLLSPGWQPVRVLDLDSRRLLARVDAEAWLTLTLEDGAVAMLDKEPAVPGLAADGVLVRLLAADGAEVWKRPLSAPVGGGLCRVGETVYAFADDEQLYLLAAATGEPSASISLGRRCRGAPGTVLHGRLWVTDLDGVLLGLDTATGKLLSETPLGEVLLTPVTGFGDGLLAVTRGRDLCRLDAGGRETARHALPTATAGVAFHDGAAWLADRSGGIWRWHPADPQPTAVVHLRQPLTDLVLLPRFSERWQLAAKSEQTDEFDLTLPDFAARLLALTADGMAITLTPGR